MEGKIGRFWSADHGHVPIAIENLASWHLVPRFGSEMVESMTQHVSRTMAQDCNPEAREPPRWLQNSVPVT